MKKYISYLKLMGILFMALFMNPSGDAMAYDEKAPLPGFAQMAEGIYRGGQPTAQGFKQLHDQSIKTIVNFRTEDEFIEFDREQTAKYDMEFIHIPWTIYGTLEDEKVEQFFEIVEDSTTHPVYIHCRRGVERTGVMAYYYARKVKGLSHKQAYQEAFKGFPLKFFWKPFVKQKLAKFKTSLPHS